MTTIIITLFIVTLLYSCMIILFRVGWALFEQDKFLVSGDYKTVSIVVAVRNESSNIARLINCLSLQEYPTEYFEIVICDDFSTDNTVALATEMAAKYPNIKLVHPDNSETGKKSALARGIQSTKGEIIVTIDADCHIAPGWLKSITPYFKDEKTEMVIGPVNIKTFKEDIFARFQAIEFLSLSAVTAGSAGLGHPLMCNGANLAFRRSGWLKSQDILKGKKYLSGDDMFLLQAIKQKGGSVQFALNHDALVTTQPSKNIQDYFSQRARWAGKFSGYSDNLVKFVALLTGITNIALVIALPIALINSPWLWAGAFAMKLVADLTLLEKANRFYKIPGFWRIYPFASVIYPAYVLMALTTSFTGTVKWKERHLKTGTVL